MERIGPYVLQGELGRGAAAVVYRALDPAGRPVAVKLLPGADPSEHARGRLRRELELLARLRHPNLVAVLDSGEAGGRPWVAMELVTGGTLEDRLRRDGPLPVRLAAGLAREVASALEHAHAAGVLHRDLKPANVLLDADGRARLADFGLARDLAASRGSLTREGGLLGTPGYWPPEQVSGEAAPDPTADVYGLGATLYALLVGRPPHVAETLPELLAATLSAAPTPPRQLRAEVPAPLERVVLRCLEKSPGRRYPSARALIEALDAAAREAAPARARRRSRLLPAVAGGGLLLLVAVVALRRRTPDDAPAATPAPAVTATAAPAASRLEGFTVTALSAERRQELLRRRSRALELAAVGDDAGALRELDAALAIDPEDPTALFNRGCVLLTLGRRGEALAAFDRVIEVAPRLAAAHYNRARVHADLGRHQAALDGATAALAIEPGMAAAWHTRATAREALGDLPGARGDYEEALRRDEAAYFSHLALGLLELQLGDPRGAERHLRRFLELRPGSSDGPLVRARLGEARSDLGDPRGAIAEFDQALALSPSTAVRAQALNGRGLARRALGDRRGAIADYGAALALAPQAGVHANRALLREEEGELTGALADYGAALALDPRHVQSLNNRGNLLTRLGRAEEARADFDRAVEAAPAYYPARVNRARVRAAAGDDAGARADLDAAIAANSTRVEGWFERGNLHSAARRGAEAVADYGEVLARDPRHASAWLNRGIARVTFLEDPGGDDDLRRALELLPPDDPGRAQATRLLARR